MCWTQLISSATQLHLLDQFNEFWTKRYKEIMYQFVAGYCLFVDPTVFKDSPALTLLSTDPTGDSPGLVALTQWAVYATPSAAAGAAAGYSTGTGTADPTTDNRG